MGTLTSSALAALEIRSVTDFSSWFKLVGGILYQCVRFHNTVNDSTLFGIGENKFLREKTLFLILSSEKSKERVERRCL